MSRAGRQGPGRTPVVVDGVPRPASYSAFHPSPLPGSTR